ncbi:MAG: hypothetical protein HC886_00165 [Leptolyngbyaceae cyanobacterium SM1_1_3]|nr:hypothetical protein [Leptolyngbyaceae cyanobacterium SM1_1_3]NJN02005.1 hypothetical protein [Leptolyngbyaceae cyanobacterium RM1_1_2]NJO08283.1 hypothetical protein [Leptolyngbyaceae cyanobacterium SL_1_1]
MHDNKVRLSPDVLDKAQQIADEWGLKNARAAVEAVFRRYSDEYLHGRLRSLEGPSSAMSSSTSASALGASTANNCEALDALDDLLAL